MKKREKIDREESWANKPGFDAREAEESRIAGT